MPPYFVFDKNTWLSFAQIRRTKP